MKSQTLNPTTRSSIASRLDEIVNKRQPLVKRLQRVETNLQTLKTIIKQLETHRQTLLRTPDNTNIAAELNTLNFPGFFKRFEFQTEQLAKLRTRFIRGTINIGVVGLMGQGKSTFLKNLSGLSDEEIPARTGGACTAVRSIIYHSCEPTKVKVTFHDEASFLKEVIEPYYSELELGTPPSSLDHFASQKLPPQPNDATKKAMYERLKNEYFARLSQYRPLLDFNSPRTIEISKAEIRNYVVHQYDANNDLISFNHLAVRQVEIFCPFNKEEVAKIGLVDIPGLGDLRVGDEKLMLKTLGEEVDVVLFVRRPDFMRYSWEERDTRLYETAKKALPDLRDRAFMVLNHISHNNGQSDNLAGCHKHQETIHEAHLEVVNCLVADCNDSKAANEVLDLILQYLADKIEDLDNRHLREHQKQLERLQTSLQEELEKANSILAKYANERVLFNQRFEELLTELSKGLRNLRDRLREQSQAIDTDFNSKVEAVLKAIEQDSGIPDIEQIDNECYSPDFKEAYISVYGVYIAQMRTHLSKHFLFLNKGLHQSLENLKSAITEIFTHQINLGSLTPSGGRHFLQEMTDVLNERNNPLELGFRTLLEAQMSYEGLILADMRQHLEEILNPNQATLNLDSTQEPALTVKTELEKLHQQVLGKCKETLQQYLTSPSRVKYFIMQEFIDQILYAKDMKKSWDELLYDPQIRVKVWTEFQKYEIRKHLQEDWKNLIQKANQINQHNNFRFLI